MQANIAELHAESTYGGGHCIEPAPRRTEFSSDDDRGGEHYGYNQHAGAVGLQNIAAKLGACG